MQTHLDDGLARRPSFLKALSTAQAATAALGSFRARTVMLNAEHALVISVVHVEATSANRFGGGGPFANNDDFLLTFLAGLRNFTPCALHLPDPFRTLSPCWLQAAAKVLPPCAELIN